MYSVVISRVSAGLGLRAVILSEFVNSSAASFSVSSWIDGRPSA
jgi:hypothetical protein